MNMHSIDISHPLDLNLGGEMGLNIEIEDVASARNNADDCIACVGSFSSGGGCVGCFSTFTSVVSCGS